MSCVATITTIGCSVVLQWSTVIIVLVLAVFFAGLWFVHRWAP